jgi:hypothetical protein
MTSRAESNGLLLLYYDVGVPFYCIHELRIVESLYPWYEWDHWDVLALSYVFWFFFVPTNIALAVKRFAYRIIMDSHAAGGSCSKKSTLDQEK